MAKHTDKKKLQLWQGRLGTNQSAYETELAKMDRREQFYRGDDTLKPMVRDDRKGRTPHVRNICAELIEAQVNSAIPQPKVTPKNKEDEKLASLIENMLRNELDRMPFEMMNDQQERTVPIQGAGMYLVEWDNAERTHTTVGELAVSLVHPKQVIPQDGVYSGIEDMDYIILRLPQTKEYIKRKYGVDVHDEGESDPEVKGIDETAADDMVTQYIAYYRNDSGGIGLYSWVGDTELEDLEDYQARRLRRCAVCGAAKPQAQLTPTEATVDGLPTDEETKRDADECPYCGGKKWEISGEDYEEVYLPITRTDGTVIPGASRELTDTGELDAFGTPIMTVTETPTRIPYYKPNIYPLLMQKNVSVFGQFLGDSDIDKIEDQQNTLNRIEAKIIDKLLQSGSYLTLPDDASIRVDSDDMKVIRPGNAANKALIDVFDLQGNISQDMAYLEQAYEESRQIIGITDSFQGRSDSTATSGKAKEFAAAQSAGRLESKRVMKNAMFAALFEAMFKFKLAYADEPRPVISTDIRGQTQYDEFNRYDFLKQDEAGEWYWNDEFLFSCDTTAPLASNREAMWQETRQNLQTGAFGDPAQLTTLVLFWTKMEMLHYPGAGETKKYLEEELKSQREQQMMQMQAQAQIQAQMQAQTQNEQVRRTIAQAKQDAAKAALSAR